MLDFMVMEAVALKVAQEDREDAKKQEIEQWKKEQKARLGKEV